MARILIVDDQPDVRTLLARFLGRAGHDVQSASSGLEALDQALHWSPDVLVLDVAMPDMDGLEVLRTLRQEPQAAHLPILILSAFSDDLTQLQARRLGAADYVIKGNIDLQDLLERVEALANTAPAG